MFFNLHSGIQRMNANLTHKSSVKNANRTNGLIKMAIIMDVFSDIFLRDKNGS